MTFLWIALGIVALIGLGIGCAAYLGRDRPPGGAHRDGIPVQHLLAEREVEDEPA